MTARQIISVLVLIVGVALGTGCASKSPDTSEKGQYSGFLGDYSMLEKTEDAAGDEVLRYVNPDAETGAYQAVLLEPTQFYPNPNPNPEPTEQVSDATLEEIRAHVDEGLREQLDSKGIQLVSEPGPGVLRVQPAITAVAPETPGLRPYQYIPIAFIVTTVRGRGEVAALNIDDKLVANLEMPYTTPSMFGVMGLSCGYAAFDSVLPEDYEAPFEFSGELRQVTLDVSGYLIKDAQVELKRMMTVQ